MKYQQLIIILTALLLANICWGQAAGEVGKVNDTELAYGDAIDLSTNEFKHETRAGLILTTGNTDSISVNGSSYTLYRIKRWENKWHLGAHYNRISSTTTGVSTGTVAKYIYGTYRLDYFFLALTTVYIGGGGYTDEIKGIDLAAQGFTGISHYFLKSDQYSLLASAGYDFTFEDHIPPNPNDSIHSATAALAYDQKFNDIVSFHQGLTAWENIKDGNDLRLHSDTELRLAMNSYLSLVLGYHLRFDNRPVPGFKKLDTITDVSLAVTFN